ncbi:hypothetical protein R3P38DRAFT_3230938 [Favolaschia claudopus]|uniref:Uncharacterized protein n=1 Tax=Favolaschia claudopus TaxID=2862362 RepID=A0AAV9ZL35_9AGAR
MFLVNWLFQLWDRASIIDPPPPPPTSDLTLTSLLSAVVSSIEVKAIIHPSKPSISDAVLFLPPISMFFTPDRSSIRYPTEQPFWFDPLGMEPLSAAQAKVLGLPEVEITIIVESQYLDQSGLEAVREFYRAKGFDPDSQDLAKHLENPLYYFGNEGDPLPEPMRFVDESDFDSDNSMSSSSIMDEDRDSDEEEQILYPRRMVQS